MSLKIRKPKNFSIILKMSKVYNSNKRKICSGIVLCGALSLTYFCYLLTVKSKIISG